MFILHTTGLEDREYGRRDPSRWPRGTIYPQKLELTSPTSGCRSVGIVRSRTQATEFSSYPWNQLGLLEIGSYQIYNKVRIGWINFAFILV
jgi:hypothetical protein